MAKEKTTFGICDEITGQWLSSFSKGDDQWEGWVDYDQDIIADVKRYKSAKEAKAAREKLIAIFKASGIPDNEIKFKIYEMTTTKAVVEIFSKFSEVK